MKLFKLYESSLTPNMGRLLTLKNYRRLTFKYSNRTNRVELIKTHQVGFNYVESVYL